MTASKNALDSYVTDYLAKDKSRRYVVRKLFLYDHPRVFQPPHDICFDIFEAVATKFQIPLGSVKAVGSAQVGYSYFSHRDFILGKSDFDVAIIDPRLFQRYAEQTFRTTAGYKDQTGFSSKDDVEKFQQYLLQGQFRPDLMPTSPEKEEWFRFFNDLSGKYRAIFKNVNAGIYFSEVFFEAKQQPLLDRISKPGKP